MPIKLTNSRGYNPMTQRSIAGGVVTAVPAYAKRNYNVFDFASYDDVERLGLAPYIDRASWEAGKERAADAAT